MNKDLERFLTFIRDHNNVSDIDNYIPSKKIFDKNLSLTCGYIAGGAYIRGIAFDKEVTIIYNYFVSPDSFSVVVDGVRSIAYFSISEILNFFTTGEFSPKNSFKFKNVRNPTITFLDED